jgi:hypothetical protein
MSMIWTPSPRLVGASTGSPLTIWLPVDSLGAAPLAPATGFPLPVQMPVFGSQLDPVLPGVVLPGAVPPVVALLPVPVPATPGVVLEPAAVLLVAPVVAWLELELPAEELPELLLELAAGCVLELELGLELELELELELLLALGLEVVPLTGLPAPEAPPVAVVHCVEPCLSQAGGCGSSSARVLVPLVEKVGLLQLWIKEEEALATWLPGICCNCAYPASTRLIGSAE